MKEKIRKHKNKIAVVTCMAASTALVIVGMKRSYDNGFQMGCNVTFNRVVKEFPDVNFGEFFAKYHK